MTNYTDNLESIQQEPMPKFYLFQSGNTIERYTSYSKSLEFLGNTYTSASITHGGLQNNIEFASISLTITTPITPAIAKYIPNQPIVPVNITIYRSHIDYLDQYEVFFKGKIKYVQMKGLLASAKCERKNRILTTKIPKIINQSFCNHDIYDDYGVYGCRVDEALYKRTAEVISISGSDITYAFTDGGGSVAAGYFQLGKINFGSDYRLITTHSSPNILGIHIPFDSSFEEGSEFTVAPGCDGSADTCINVFNNLRNRTAMPYIPSTNPVIWGFR